MKDSVLTWRNKYTGMCLVHYACEYPCQKFLKSLVRVKGAAFTIEQICLQTKNGKNGLHFLAQNHASKELAYLRKILLKINLINLD